jgi:hypothetical protein
VVLAYGATGIFRKTVLVDPDAVRAAQLFIDEALGRLPKRDFAAPAHGNAANLDAVIDFGALLHGRGSLGDELDVKQLSGGRTAYWNDAEQTVVITDPANPDGGTAFRSTDGKSYFDTLK